ncbi:MAG: UDP-3-O-(3-hydroxymyristoyl)glucosamine N-acyltransferase, partial [Bacteroidia bacterium]|nr:UDP-3-O-(3-hydroxymyristoyl)glucosamine N-acyltransferase [Bacteroidia bacterium]
LQADGYLSQHPSISNVVIEDYVNIGANTTIDRATIGSTIIRQGVKLDNLIQIGHNVEIGENTVISAQTGISGSSKIGKNCVIGGQVGFSNSIKIADNTKIGAQSGINGNIKKSGRSLLGYPAFDYIGFMKSSVIFRKLPDLQRRIEQLEETLKNNTEE